MAGAELISITLDFSLEQPAPPLSASRCQPRGTLRSIQYSERSGCPRRPAPAAPSAGRADCAPPPGWSSGLGLFRAREGALRRPLPRPHSPSPACHCWNRRRGSRKTL